MASVASVVVQEVMDEINLENNPLDIQNSYSTDGDANEELHRDLMESPDGEKSTENCENTDTETEDQDLREETEERNTSVTAQNSLDVLSKACENITEGNESTDKNQLSFTGECQCGEYDETHDEQQHCNVEEGENSFNNGIESEFFEDYIGHEDQYPGTPDTMAEQGLRKSGRKRRPRPVSPDVTHRSSASYKKPRANLYHKANHAKKVLEVPFKCDLCSSPYITDPTRRGNRPKMSTTSASPRHKRDPETGKMLTLCNACGLSFNRAKKSHEKIVVDPDAKRMYLEEGYQFAASLAEGLDEQDALRLYCPRYKTFPCGCIQKYILTEGDMDESRLRAQHLLTLLKQSKLLSKQKCYNTEEAIETQLERKGKRGRNIGLGNGQRKSKEFEEFVLNERKYLREDLKLCEQGTQRVLNYSNNFLHKKLKTDPAKPLRVERQKGQAVLGKLKTIEDLPAEDCCVDKCASMAITHSKLLQQWRNRSVSGQAEARRVLAEMLTPSGGARSNCYKFISWVTGCSHSTIGRVNEQMKKTGGDREPPVHGLINWWKENPKPKKVKVKAVAQHSVVSSSLQMHHLSATQLQSMSQIGILQAAANSVGISTTALPPSQLSTNPQVITINAAHLAHLNVPSTSRQVILTPTQHTQFQLQQLQQQQQQIQLQTLQLQQQLQQQLQHEQQETEQTQPIQIQIPSQVISTHDGTCLTLASSHDFPSGSFTTTLHPVSQVQTVIPSNCIGSVTQVQQSVPLAAETFLTSDTLQILNSGQTQTVAPHVVTLQCSETTANQAVPVSMIHTPVSLAL